MNAPIADSVDQELKTNTERGRQSERRLHEASQAASGTFNVTPRAEDFMRELLDAQQRLISAQHQVLHDGDVVALARAQLDVIGVQTGVLQRMGVFG